MAVDVLNDPGGRDRLLALGVRNVPVVARGREYVFAQNTGKLLEFLGLGGTRREALAPAQLYQRWTTVLRAAQRYVRQIPDATLAERVIPNRERPIRLLGHHVFRICAAFLESAVDGVAFDEKTSNLPPAEGTCLTGEQIAQYGEGVIARLDAWWQGLADRSCTQPLATYYGTQSTHELFERSTWHSAQHTRQLIAVLDRLGIEPDGRLMPQDLAGLPLPAGLWE